MTMSAMLPPIVKDPSPPIVSAAAQRAAAGMSAEPADAMAPAEASAVLMVPHKPGRTPRPCRGESQLSSSPIVRTACAVHPSRAMCRRPSNGMFAADFGHARGSSGTGGAPADPLIHRAGSSQDPQQTMIRNTTLAGDVDRRGRLLLSGSKSARVGSVHDVHAKLVKPGQCEKPRAPAGGSAASGEKTGTGSEHRARSGALPCGVSVPKPHR
jgi:hypothetical protein